MVSSWYNYRKPVHKHPLQSIGSPLTFKRYNQQAFYGRLEALGAEVEKALLQQMAGDENAVSTLGSASRYNLGALPSDMRDDFMRRYKKLIGFNEVIAQGRPEDSRWLKGLNQRNPAATYRVGGTKNDPLSHIWRNLYVQFKTQPTGLKTPSGLEHYSIGASIPKVSTLKRETAMITNARRSGASMIGKSAFVFDIETMGLTQSSGIRQVAGSKFNIGGAISRKATHDVNFRAALGEFGFLYDGGEYKTINQFIGVTDKAAGSGASLAQGMRPVLQEMISADYIAGHNISGFDIGQLFGNLRKTKSYKEDLDGFRGLVDQAFDAANTRQLDTLQLARSFFGDKMTQAFELGLEGKGSLYSLENILLQSNLLDVVSNKSGISAAELLKLHSADTDVFFESHLLQSLLENMSGSAEGAARLRVRSLTDPGLRSAISRSYALTPVSKIMNPSQISPDMMRALIRDGGVSITPMRGGSVTLGGKKINLNKSGISKIMNMAGKDDAAAEELYGLLTSENPLKAIFKVTPIEQQVFATRNLGLSASVGGPIEDTLLNSSLFDDFAGVSRTGDGFLNRDYTLYKTGNQVGDYAELMSRLNAMKTPFAGISLHERWLMTALSSATAEGGINATERQVAGLATDLGVARWSKYKSAYVSENLRNITLPQETLEALGINFENRLFDLRPFKFDDKFNVNLSLKLDDKEIKAVIKNLTAMSYDEGLMNQHFGEMMQKLGITDVSEFRSSVIDPIMKAFPQVARERGIGVAKISGDAAQQIHRVWEDIMGQISTDEQSLSFRVAYMSGDESTLRTTGTLLDRFVTFKERSTFLSDAQVAKKKYNELLEFASKKENRSFMALAEATQGNEQAARVAKKVIPFYNKMVRPNVSKFVGGSVLALGAYYVNKRRVEQNQYDDTVNQMPYESASVYSNYGIDEMVQMRLETGEGSYGQQMDPLATSGIVSTLDANRIGHTNMSWNKNTSLFGGVL